MAKIENDLIFHLHGQFGSEKRYIAVVVDEKFEKDNAFGPGIVRSYKATSIFDHMLPRDLDRLGCTEDLDEVESLGIGESIALGFPQGMYNGVMIMRIG